jgi:hypothetical protein
LVTHISGKPARLAYERAQSAGGGRRNGVDLENPANSNVVAGNHIGTNALGTAGLDNFGDGVFINGSASNIITRNWESFGRILIFATGRVPSGTFIISNKHFRHEDEAGWRA